MAIKRRRFFTTAFKAKVAPAAVKGDQTVAALAGSCPEIFNTDQGSQFTSRFFTDRLMSKSIEISMDGRGRALDNVFIERLWRSVKYEDIYLKGYESGADCQKGLTSYFKFYSHERPHQSLDYRTPWEVHTSRC